MPYGALTYITRDMIYYLALTAAAILWATPFLLAKLSEPYLGTGHMMLYRFAFAAAGFLPLLLRGRWKLSRRDWRLVGIAAIIGVPIQFMLQFEGVARTTVAHASLMVGTAPVLVALAAYFVFHERLGRTAWYALIASTIGVTLIVAESATVVGGATFKGDMLVFASMFGGVVWILICKDLMKRLSPIAVSTLVTLVGTAMLSVWVLATEGAPPTSLPLDIWGALIAMGLAGTFCTTLLWNWGLSHVDAGRAGVFINLEPVVGTLLGVTILHEALGVTTIVGGLLIVGAAVVISTQSRGAAGQLRAAEGS